MKEVVYFPIVPDSYQNYEDINVLIQKRQCLRSGHKMIILLNQSHLKREALKSLIEGRGKAIKSEDFISPSWFVHPDMVKFTYKGNTVTLKEKGNCWKNFRYVKNDNNLVTE